MSEKKIVEKLLIGFLPKEFQRNYGEKNNVNTSCLTFFNSVFVIFISLIFLFSFLGFYIKFDLGLFWILLVLPLFVIFIIDSLIRIISMLFKRNFGFLPFSLFNRYLLKLNKSADFEDDVLEIKDVLLIHSPCPKPHWVKWGGISYNNKAFKITKQIKLEISHFFKFEKSEETFPQYDPQKEKKFNISSDLSLIFSPLWGFLPEKYQYSLLKYERYNFRFYFYFSILLTLFVSFPSMIFDLIRIMQKMDVLIIILPHFLMSLYFVYEALMRLVIFLTERKIKGSLLNIFIKPLYYMIYEEFL